MNNVTRAARWISLLVTPLVMWGCSPGEAPQTSAEPAPTAEAASAEMDHSQHQMEGHAGHSTERDEMGRRLYDMKHDVTDEVADQLRAKVPLYSTYSNAEIALSMVNMGPNYEWYISGNNVEAEQGLLILAHGYREKGDAAFREKMQPVADVMPTALSFGMSMMMSDHIQLAIDDLEAAGAKEIVVIPIVSTKHNTMMRQWQYIFGELDEPSYAAVPPVTSNAKLYLVSPIEDDPLVAEILIDHASEISEDPDNELVIIAAHGPSFEDDNLEELAMLENIAKVMREDSDFQNVVGITLQDDAAPEVRQANVDNLRAMVSEANEAGKDVLIVTNLMGTRTVQAKLRKDLKGLDYKFSAKGLSSHDNFMKWIMEAMRDEFERT